jgi:hypothetical protein
MPISTQQINVSVNSEFGQVSTTVIPAPNVIINAGQQGLTGPPGPSGPPAAALVGSAGVNITEVGTVIVLTTAGTLIPADPTNPAHASLLLGMNLTIGLLTESIQYITVGEINGMSGLSIGELYFVGLAGSIVLQSDLPVDGATWSRALGNPQSATSFILDKQTPIML